MAARKAAPAAKRTKAGIDPRSPVVVLEYVTGRTPRFVPARDLTGGDLGRIAYRRAALRVRSERSTSVKPGERRQPPTRPGRPTAADVTAIAEELVATGRFVRVEPTTTVTPTPPAQPATQEA